MKAYLFLILLSVSFSAIAGKTLSLPGKCLPNSLVDKLSVAFPYAHIGSVCGMARDLVSGLSAADGSFIFKSSCHLVSDTTAWRYDYECPEGSEGMILYSSLQIRETVEPGVYKSATPRDYKKLKDCQSAADFLQTLSTNQVVISARCEVVGKTIVLHSGSQLQ